MRIRKYIALLLTIILWAGNARGQIQDDVLRILKSGNITAFKQFSDSLSNQENRTTAYWESFRDLTPDFWEGVFIVEKSVRDTNDPNSSSVFLFKVSMIVTKTQIASYELSEQKYRKIADQWESYDDPIAQFQDEQLFKDLKFSFKSIFHTELNEQDLFSSELVYGERCGFAGTYPEGRYQIIQFVKDKNKEELLKWLKSANSEKQVYAVDGLYQLYKQGTKLTEEELNMIAFVMHKSGKIRVCHGCMHTKDDIKTVLAEFNF